MTGTLYDQGERGTAWSSDEVSTAKTYALHFYTTEVRPQHSGPDSKSAGLPVRCIELSNDENAPRGAPRASAVLVIFIFLIVMSYLTGFCFCTKMKVWFILAEPANALLL